MAHPGESRVADLNQLGRIELCDLWKETFGTRSPQLRRDLMIPMLAYRIQEQAGGSQSASSRGRLRQLAKAFERDSKAAILSSPTIKPGTRLVRQWGEKVHLVNVETKGYEYQGVRYQSLSEIARLITGTRWSGPLFFGIKNPFISKSKELA